MPTSSGPSNAPWSREHDDRGHAEHEAGARARAVREIDDLVLREREERTEDQDRAERPAPGRARRARPRCRSRPRPRATQYTVARVGIAWLHAGPFEQGGGGKASVTHLSVVAETSAASEQQRSHRRREQCNADVDLLHGEITLFESSSLAHS